MASSSSASSGAGGGVDCLPPSQPELLTTVAGEAFNLAIDDAYAYFPDQDAGTVSRVSFCTHAVTILATGETNPTSIVVDDDSVIWGTSWDHGEVRIAPLAGGTPTTLWKGGQVESIALDGSRIYFAAWESQSGKQGVWAVDKDGANATELYAGEIVRPIGLDATSVYFSANDGSRRLLKVPKTGGAAVLVAHLQVQGGFATNDTGVYAATWQGGMQGANVVGFIGASMPVIFASSQQEITDGVAVTPDRVVWANQDQGSIFAAPLGGGAATAVASGLQIPEKVVYRNGVLAWTTFGDRGVWRMQAP